MMLANLSRIIAAMTVVHTCVGGVLGVGAGSSGLLVATCITPKGGACCVLLLYVSTLQHTPCSTFTGQAVAYGSNVTITFNMLLLNWP